MNKNTIAMKKNDMRRYLPHVFAVLAVLVVKYHYTTSTIHGLNWILLPTSKCVQMVSGIEFTEESGCGFVNFEHGINIARSCAGVNFLIVAFLAVGLSFVNKYKEKRALFLVLAAVSAYGTTLIVNTLRILLSIKTYEAAISFGWFTEERIHRIEGVVVYLVFLCLYYYVVKALIEFSIRLQTTHNSPRNAKRIRLSRWYAPLVIYLIFTLCIPMLTSIYRTNLNHLFEHSLVVLSCTGIIFLMLGMLQFVLDHNYKTQITYSRKEHT